MLLYEFVDRVRELLVNYEEHRVAKSPLMVSSFITFSCELISVE